MSSIDAAPATIDFDLPCVDCTYNLRMQPADARCPECGLSIAETARRSALLWSVARADRLASGLGFLALANTLTLGGLVVAFLLLLASSEGGIFVLLLALCVTGFLHMFAAWHMTSPEEGEPADAFDHLLRAGSIAGFAGTCFLLFITLLSLAGVGAFSDAGAAAMVFILGGLMLGGAGYVVLLSRRLRTVCRTCGFPSLARAARWTIAPAGACMLLLALCLVVLSFIMGLSLDVEWVIGDAISILFSLAVLGELLFGIAATVTLFLMYLRFGRIREAIAARARPPSAGAGEGGPDASAGEPPAMSL